MTVLFGGGEIGAVIPSDANVAEDTTAGRFDSAFARCAISVTGSSSYYETFSFAPQDDIWFRFDYRWGGGSCENSVKCFEALNSSDVGLFKIESPGSGGSAGTTLQMYYWDGAAYQTLGSVVSADTRNSRQTFDLHIEGGGTGSGTATLYLSNTHRATGTADFTAVTDIAKFRGYGRGSVCSSAYSQLAATTGESTIGGRLMTVVATGTGATDQWTNGYASIDETVYSDADFIFSPTADQVELFAGTPVGSLTGYTARAVIVTARANTDGAGPANLKLAIRSASTTALSSAMALDAGYEAFVAVWETDPATTLNWTAEAAAAFQFGGKSIA